MRLNLFYIVTNATHVYLTATNHHTINMCTGFTINSMQGSCVYALLSKLYRKTRIFR